MVQGFIKVVRLFLETGMCWMRFRLRNALEHLVVG